jgi:hypothetical protein
MRRLGWVTSVGMVAAMGAASVACAQGEAPPPPPPRAGVLAQVSPRAMEPERAKAMVARLNLTEAESAAAVKAVLAKAKVRQALQDELAKLRTVANDEQATDEQITKQLDAVTAARRAYRTVARDEDQTLTAALSVRGRARCLAAGILDNGLTMMGGGRGPGGPGGGGGGMGGGNGPGPGGPPQ